MMVLSRRMCLRTAIGISVGSTVKADKLAGEARLPVVLAGGPMPTLDNGIVSILDSQLTTVSLVDLKGNLLGSFSPRLPDAAVERILHVAVSSSKRVVLAMAGKDASGRYSFFLAFADYSGKITGIVQMHPFAPRRIMFLPDGRLLCLGREYDSHHDAVPGHNVLRFFSPAGVLQKAALKVTSLDSKATEQPFHWILVPGTGRIGLLDTEDRRYCEIDYEGKIIRPLDKLGIDAPDQVTGMALLPNGDRLVTLDSPKLEGGVLRYGYVCSAGQITETQGGSISVRPRPDLIASGNGKFVMALGCHDGKLVMLARSPDRLLIFES